MFSKIQGALPSIDNSMKALGSFSIETRNDPLSRGLFAYALASRAFIYFKPYSYGTAAIIGTTALLYYTVAQLATKVIANRTGLATRAEKLSNRVKMVGFYAVNGMQIASTIALTFAVGSRTLGLAPIATNAAIFAGCTFAAFISSEFARIIIRKILNPFEIKYLEGILKPFNQKHAADLARMELDTQYVNECELFKDAQCIQKKEDESALELERDQVWVPCRERNKWAYNEQLDHFMSLLDLLKTYNVDLASLEPSALPEFEKEIERAKKHPSFEVRHQAQARSLLVQSYKLLQKQKALIDHMIPFLQNLEQRFKKELALVPQKPEKPQDPPAAVDPSPSKPSGADTSAASAPRKHHFDKGNQNDLLKQATADRLKRKPKPNGATTGAAAVKA